MIPYLSDMVDNSSRPHPYVPMVSASLLSILFHAQKEVPLLRYNEINDYTSFHLTEICNNVGVEPYLQPLDDEALKHATSNRDD